MDKLIVRIKQLFLIMILIFSCITSIRAQDELEIADSLRVIGNYNLELKYYILTYNRNPTNSENIYNMACCYALLTNKDSAFYYLNRSIDLGQDDGWALADYDLLNLHQDYRWREIESRLENIYKQKNPKTDTQLGWEISKMFFEDQAPKLASDNIMKKYGMPSPQMDSIDRVIANIDSLNMLNLERIFNKFGWTGKKLIGLEGADRAFIIILHAPLT